MITAIIPSKNTLNLEKCLEAWFLCEPAAQAVVIDDGLEDFDAQLWFPRVTVLAGQKPFIYARNCNIGIKHALASGAKHVVLLNDDAEIQTPLLISAMVASWPNGVGLAAPACTNVGNLRQKPKYAAGWVEEPRMVCFTCAVIPRSTIETVGLLDERFNAYGFDDDDYCLRVRQAGLKIAICHDGWVRHDHLPSTFRAAGYADLSAGRKIFIEKWGRHPL